jgi:predicted nucleotide-binding protein
MSAKEALDYLTSRRMHYQDAVSAICTRAHAGLVDARAKTLLFGSKRNLDGDVPTGFWWAEGHEELTQDWATGYFETWLNHDTRVQAFDVTFRRKDIEHFAPATAESPAPRRGQRPSGRTVFIGHGHSEEWRKLYIYLGGVHGLAIKEFNSGSSPVGISVTDYLQNMLDEAGFAFLILTGDDAQASGELYPRLNVVHEAGLFQGKLGFRNAIIFIEDGCQGFSNVDGLTVIRFEKGKIEAKFHQAIDVLKREKLIS